MKLYKYHAVDKNALSALARKKIWATNPIKFDDPFDCEASLLLIPLHPAPVQIGPGGSGGMVQPSIIEGPISEDQKKWVEEMGVYCLCKKNDNRLMWGHYADGFRGFCLQYTFDDDKLDELVRVKYPKCNRRPTRDWPEDQLAFIKEAARYKAKDWRYEKEYRLVFQSGGRYYARPAEAEITGIIFGTLCEPEDKKTISRLIEPGLQRWRVNRKPNSYDLIIEEDSGK